MIVAVGQDKSREAFYTTSTFIHPEKNGDFSWRCIFYIAFHRNLLPSPNAPLMFGWPAGQLNILSKFRRLLAGLLVDGVIITIKDPRDTKGLCSRPNELDAAPIVQFFTRKLKS